MYFIEFAYVSIDSQASSTVWYCVYNYGGIAGANQEADLAFFSQTAIQSIQKKGDIFASVYSGKCVNVSFKQKTLEGQSYIVNLADNCHCMT